MTLSQYIYSAAPWSRFIVLFRDPVDRYQSAFYYYRTKADGVVTLDDLHRKAVADIAEWDSCIRREKDELKCLKLYNPQQLVKGMYGAFISPWLEVWPRDRFLFIRTGEKHRWESHSWESHAWETHRLVYADRLLPPPYLHPSAEDYKASPLEHVAMVTEFLGMRDMTEGGLKKAVSMEKRNEKRYSKMQDQTRELLQRFYRPFNERLMRQMGNDERWLWGY